MDTVDDYLAQLDDEQRAALQRLRECLQAAIPEAEECISYQQPAFRLGRVLVSYGATKNHCALYLMSSTVIPDFADDLTRWKTSKGTIRFQPDQPLPKALIHKLVRARLREDAALYPAQKRKA